LASIIRRTSTAWLALVVGGLLVPAQAAAPPPYPNENSAPKIQGSDPRQDGQALTASPGSWSPDPNPGSSVTFAYQWLRCTSSTCEAIPGATGQTYGLTAGEVGRQIKVRVTANCTTPVVCEPMTREAGPTSTVLPDPSNEGAPEVTGTAAQGQLLSASVGFWRSVAPLSFGYQWVRCDKGGGACGNIAGATGAQYRLTAADAAHTLRVGVTARNSRPRALLVFSSATAAVKHAAAKRSPVRSPRMISPFPRIVLAGVLTDGGVDISEFTIRGPRGPLVSVRCRGRGCPVRSKRLRMRRTRVRVRALERSLRAGIVIDVTVTRKGFIGKFSRFRIRRGKVPLKRNLCLRPGAKKPTRCPR
jgi:hypothetical protein